jgi:hypothetical protein
MSILSSKVKHSHGQSPHAVQYNGERAYTFKYSCVRHGKKFTINGIISTDNHKHAEGRTSAIYGALKKEINKHHDASEKKLTSLVKKQLHHSTDLKKIDIKIK